MGRGISPIGLVWPLAILSLLSSLLFISQQVPPKFDDSVNMQDVLQYKENWAAGVANQINAPGPISFMWGAVGASVFDDPLFGARLAMWTSWLILLGSCAYAAVSRDYYHPLQGFILAALLFPHSISTQALVLTEGPALLLATLGVIVWVTSLRYRSLAGQAGAALLIGLAVCARQYYLALIPAVLLATLFESIDVRLELVHLSSDLLRIVLLGLVMILPVAMLVTVWGGITSPGIRSGSTYAGVTLGVGFSSRRLFEALGCLLYYTGFFVLPVALRRWRQANWAILLPTSAALTLIIVAFTGDVLPLGPIRTIVLKLHELSGLEVGLILGSLLFLPVLATFLALQALPCRTIPKELLLTISGGFILLFVLEQLFISGSIPFYDRYAFTVVPFVGILFYSRLENLGLQSALYYLALAAVGHLMLWRYAFA